MRALILALLFVSFSAFADDITVQFTAPTEREDGTLLPADEIANYRVFVEDNKGNVIDQPIDKTLTEFPLTLDPGVFSVYMTTVDTDGRESLFSNQIQVISKANPRAPIIIIVR